MQTICLSYKQFPPGDSERVLILLQVHFKQSHSSPSPGYTQTRFGPLTHRQAQDVIRGGQGEAEPPGVVTDDLEETQTGDNTGREEGGAEHTCSHSHTDCFLRVHHRRTAADGAPTCLSSSRSAYLMLGSSKVMAGLLLEKKSLKIRLTMLSKPPRIS